MMMNELHRLKQGPTKVAVLAIRKDVEQTATHMTTPLYSKCIVTFIARSGSLEAECM